MKHEKFRLLLSASLASLVISTPALAEGLPAATIDWSGFYAGVSADATFSGHSASTDYGGIYGGYIDPTISGIIGYNWQRGNAVFGIEGYLTGGERSGELDWYSTISYQNRYEWNWSGTVRGRVGVTAGNVLLYGAAGLTYADVSLDACEQGRFDAACAVNNWSTFYDGGLLGFTAAIGAEFVINNQLSGFVEYNTTSFAHESRNTNRNGEVTEITPHTINSDQIRFGLNYAIGGDRHQAPATTYQSDANWAGAYAGVFATNANITNHSGYYYGGTRTTETDQTLGLSGGYNWQRGNFVFGVEGDISGPMQSNKVWGDDYGSNHEWNWLATIRGRAGISTGPLLFYTTAGLAIADLDMNSCEIASNVTVCDPSSSNSSATSGVSVGLATGFGIGYAISENLAFNAEYMYVGFPFETGGAALSGGGASSPGPHTAEVHMLRAGLTYKVMPGVKDLSDPMHDWSGAYAGVFGSGNLMGIAGGGYYGNTSIMDVDGAIGASAGYNFQNGSFVYGVEADIQSSTGPTQSTYNDEDYYLNSSNWNWSGSVRARAGIATGKALLFVTAGVAIADTELWHCYEKGSCFDKNNLNDSSDSYFEGIQFGITGGFGAEYALTDNISLVSEYRFTTFGAQRGEDQSDGVFSDHTTWAHGVKAGLNFSF